jgi:Cu2+-exporting ATPase
MSLPERADLVARCPHCGSRVAGDLDAYCCAGCEMAARIVLDAGLAGNLLAAGARPGRPEALRGDWSSVAVRQTGPTTCEASLVVDGITCASCTWLVEHVLLATDGVANAQVSYATGRARIQWDPTRTTLPDLAGRIAAVGYQPRPIEAAASPDRDLLVRLGIAAFAASNVMLLAASTYTGWWQGMEEKYAALFRWSSLLLATPAVLYSAVPFFDGAWRGLKHRFVGMDVPIALAIGLVYAHGVAATLVGVDGYLDSLCMLVALLLAGRMLEARGRKSGAEAAAALAASLPTRARRLTTTGIEEIAADDLVRGDEIAVGLGEEIPADGVVATGSAEVHLALLTGEADPIRVGPGDEVVAGAPILSGAVTVRVERVGADTVGRRMAAELEKTLDRGLSRSPADRFAPAFTVASVVLAVVAGVAWGATVSPQRGVEVAAAVLVVACPCALGLSWPLAAAAGLGALSRRGVVLRSGDALLRLVDVRRVALDKTGTATHGAPDVVDADDAVLRVAAALEAASNHPIARAIRREAARRDLALPRASDLREVVGAGVAGTVEGRGYALRAGGPGEVLLLGDGAVAGTIRLADRQRPEGERAIAGLRRLGCDVTLLTGDRVAPARALAEALRIDDVRAELRPEDKHAWVDEAQRAGHPVLFVGDGLNDGPALAAAHVSLAMRDGATASLLAADGVVVGGELGGVTSAIRTARVVRYVVRRGMLVSAIYNVSAVGAAMAGYVDPLVAAVLMPLSSGLVVLGALTVERHLRQEESRWS